VQAGRVSVLYSTVLRRGFLPNARTYTHLVEAAVRSGDMRQAEQCLDEMRKSRITPEIDAYSAVIRVQKTTHIYAFAGIC
jgi:pentatricopeptide repeat protein